MLRAAVALLVVLAASSISCAHATAEPNDCDEGRVVQTTDGCVCRAGDSDVTCSQGEVCTSGVMARQHAPDAGVLVMCSSSATPPRRRWRQRMPDWRWV